MPFQPFLRFSTVYHHFQSFSVIVYTISHLTFISFISSFTVVLYAQTFVIVYSHTYLTQSPNIALLSCLLRTLGIVSYIYAQYISCLLRTLALCCLVLASRNLAVTFCTLPHTCLISVSSLIIIAIPCCEFFPSS